MYDATVIGVFLGLFILSTIALIGIAVHLKDIVDILLFFKERSR